MTGSAAVFLYEYNADQQLGENSLKFGDFCSQD